MAAIAGSVGASKDIQQLAIMAIMQGVVQGGANRQVVAAAAAAVLRTALSATCCGLDSMAAGGGQSMDGEVSARMEAVKASILAQGGGGGVQRSQLPHSRWLGVARHHCQGECRQARVFAGEAVRGLLCARAQAGTAG